MKSSIIYFLIILLTSCSSTKNTSESANNIGNVSTKVERVDLSDLEQQCKGQDLTSALKNLSSQYSNYKNETNYWNLIGACFLNDMKPLKARLFFLRSLEEDKSNAAALNNLGVVYWQMDKHYEALAYLKRAEQVDGGSVPIKYNLARLYAWYGLHKISQEKFSQVPPDALSGQDYNYVATNQAMLGDFDNAVKNFRATRQHNVKLQAVYAYALKKSGKKDDATTEWNQTKISEQDPLKWLWIIGE